MTTKGTKGTSTLAKMEIKPIESRYSAGSWSGVALNLEWRFGSTSVSILEERSAAAVGHRLVADILEATPPTERWNVSTEVLASYRNVVSIKVEIELATGERAEIERARELLAEIAKGIK